MAPKRPTPMDNPPPSSDEEETTSSGEEEEDGEEGESSSEDEQAQKPQKTAPSPPQLTQTAKAVIKKPDPVSKQAKPGSESESETESDSESDDVPISNVKPIASKPMEDTPTKSQKPISKTSTSTIVPGKSSTTTKRSSEVEKDAKESKRAKTKDSESNGALEKPDDTKKILFQRLWSEDDEVALLEGIIDYIEKKGVDPTKDMNAYYDFIKKSLHFDVSLNQLKDKVFRLKKKFENHVTKGKKGENKTFSKPHDQKMFDLSRKLWGSEGISGRSKSLAQLKVESGVRMGEGEKTEKMETDVENHVGSKDTPKFDRGVVSAIEDYVIKRGLDTVKGAKKSEMEKKWKKLQVAELELYVQRNELLLEQAKLMLDGFKSE